MVQPKYSPEEALERVKLMMSYDMSKTLNENKQSISEQSTTDVLKQVTAYGVLGATAGGVGTFGVGAVPGAIVGGILGLTLALMGGNVSRNKLKQLIQSCSSKKDLGKKTLSDSELDSIGDSLNTAMRDIGTDEDEIKAAFAKVPTIPDLCAVVDNYNEFHGNLINDLDDDLDGDDEWRDYVYLPLRRAIRASKEASETVKKDDRNKITGIGSGPKKSSKNKVKKTYQPCSGAYSYGCKANAIKEVQACLGLVADGKFGPKTKAALKSKGFTSFTDSEISKICGKTQSTPTLPKDEFNVQVDADKVDDILNF